MKDLATQLRLLAATFPDGRIPTTHDRALFEQLSRNHGCTLASIETLAHELGVWGWQQKWDGNVPETCGEVDDPIGVTEAARLIGMPPDTLRRRIQRGELKRYGSRFRPQVSRAELAQLRPLRPHRRAS